MQSFCFFIVFVVCQIQQSLGCGGFTVNITTLSPCAKDNIVTLSDDYGIVLDKDCNIYMTGCMHITKGFETVKIKYTLNKQPLPTLEGTVDLCDLTIKYSEEAREPLEKFGFPTKCPIKKMDICGSPDKSYNIAKYKGQLGMAKGQSELKLEADHGEVGKTCMNIGVYVNKPRMRKKNNNIRKIIKNERN